MSNHKVVATGSDSDIYNELAELQWGFRMYKQAIFYERICYAIVFTVLTSLAIF